MSEYPEDIMKAAEADVSEFVAWINGGNTTGSLSEHAIAGLKHSFASAILAERVRCAEVARQAGARAIEASIRYFGEVDNDFARYDDGARGASRWIMEDAAQ